MTLWEQQLAEARKLPESELRRHASISKDNRHRCADCFCCAALTVLEQRTQPQNNCDGSGPHVRGEVRLMPTGGGGNMIFCRSCWERELRYRRLRNLEVASPFDLPTWEEGKEYGAEVR